MILAPAAPNACETSIRVRPIGVLDRVLVESISDAFAGLTAPGNRTLIVMVRDLVAMGDASLDRFLAMLDAFRTAGNRVLIDATPTWRKMVRGRGPQFEEVTAAKGLGARRQIIICHSSDKRAGAA
jgi:anti-anti-sigma regulatory factor